VAWGGAYGLFTPLGVLRRGLSPARKPPALSDVRSILAIRLDLLGDLVFTLPAVRALHEAAPSARLTLLVQPYAADLVGNLSYVDRVVTVDVQRWRKPGVWTGPAWSELRRALSELRGERYDLCVSFYGRIGAAAALLSGARYLVGYAVGGLSLQLRSRASWSSLPAPAARGRVLSGSSAGAGGFGQPGWVHPGGGSPGRGEGGGTSECRGRCGE